MRWFLLCGSLLACPVLAAPADLPDTVTARCVAEPAPGALINLRCGPSRVLVAQLNDVTAPVHEEILDSMLDLVPAPWERDEQRVGDLIITAVAQARDQVARGETSARLVLTSRLSNGRSVACLYTLDGRRRTRRREQTWCQAMREALLPPRPSAVSTTRVQVTEPDLPDEDVGRTLD